MNEGDTLIYTVYQDRYFRDGTFKRKIDTHTCELVSKGKKFYRVRFKNGREQNVNPEKLRVKD